MLIVFLDNLLYVYSAYVCHFCNDMIFLGNQIFVRIGILAYYGFTVGFIVSKILSYLLYFIPLLADVLHK